MPSLVKEAISMKYGSWPTFKTQYVNLRGRTINKISWDGLEIRKGISAGLGS